MIITSIITQVERSTTLKQRPPVVKAPVPFAPSSANISPALDHRRIRCGASFAADLVRHGALQADVPRVTLLLVAFPMRELRGQGIDHWIFYY